MLRQAEIDGTYSLAAAPPHISNTRGDDCYALEPATNKPNVDE